MELQEIGKRQCLNEKAHFSIQKKILIIWCQKKRFKTKNKNHFTFLFRKFDGFFSFKKWKLYKKFIISKKKKKMKCATFSFTFFLRTISPDDVSQQKGIVLLLCVVYLRYWLSQSPVCTLTLYCVVARGIFFGRGLFLG